MSLFHPRTIVLHPDYKDLKDFVLSIPEKFKNDEGTIVYKGRNELRLFKHNGVEYVVKAFRTPHIINQFVYGIFRPSKAKRSYDHAQMLLDIGVGTPRPVGYMNVRKGILFDKSYYISLKSECTHIYSEVFEKEFDYLEDILRAIGRMTAQLHEHGYAHKDYGRANILFEKTNEGIKLEVVDLNRMHIGPLDVYAGCKNLERLPATPEMHRWIAEEYAKMRGFDAEQCFQLMEKYRSTQTGLVDGKY